MSEKQEQEDISQEAKEAFVPEEEVSDGED
jgi:hypothetical protein